LDYIFLDFENLAVQTIPDHIGIEKVFIFAGEKQNKVSLDIAESMQKLGSKAKLIRIKGTGHNALDFHIAYYIGKSAEIDPKGTFKIVSKDKGFDPLVKHLIAEGINCQRIETLATKLVSKKNMQEIILDLGAHFKDKSDKARPKKLAKLKAYIKNRIKEEDAIVEMATEGLISNGIIEVNAGKIKYGEGLGKI
jgi:hypothetical protein